MALDPWRDEDYWPPMHQRYEPCVIDAEGNCTRFSHNHDEPRISDSPELRADQRSVTGDWAVLTSKARKHEYSVALVFAWVCLLTFCAVFWYGAFTLLRFVVL